MAAPRPDGPAAVMWDMDGTLVDSEKVWTVALLETARRLGGELSPVAREAMIGTNTARTLELMFADLGLSNEPARARDTAAYLTERTGELFEEGLVWRPGAREALAMVAAAGWPSALVTNTERGLTEKALDVIGREHFAATVCGGEAPRGKPAPDPYLRGAELLGVAAGSCLAIEDSPTGTESAERSGAAVLVVPCDTTVPPGPGRVIRESLVGLTPDDVRTAFTGIAAVTRLR